MKRKLALLLTAFLLLSGMSSWGQFRTEASIDFSEQGYANAQDMDGIIINIDENVTIVFNQASGSNVPKYYNSGTAIRVYGGNNFVVSSTNTITYISLTFGSGDGSNELTTDVGDFDSQNWTGSSPEVTFTVGGTTGHRRIKAVSVTYESGASQQYVATPTFSPEAGTYYEALSVSISCATEGSIIYYTNDGTDPTENSTVYTEPIMVSETTTIKAIAMKEGYLNSNIASATYIISDAPSIITIAEAHALENNEYALVQGVVTFIENRSVYVQDATGGICLYLNQGTVPAILALGDMVQAYGQKTVYKGLIELQYIDGSDADMFSILSSGNELPLAVKTIAEILEDGADALQSTRVKIEVATIGAINTSGNTPLTQGEFSTNIYKVPTLTDIIEGDVVDVIGVIGYYNVAQIRVALSSDITLSSSTPNPQLVVNPTQLEGFQYIYNNGPSQVMSFTVSGSGLQDEITITAHQDFEITTDLEEIYSNTISLFPTDGTLSETIVYVRMKANLAIGTYPGNITLVSGSLNATVTLNGTVDEAISDIITIAEARALENNAYARVEGTVIFIDNRNVYIQDETAGIDLYLNQNTVPENLAVGDNVRAYGSKAVFRGLVELSGINGNNADEFSILSSGNELPLAVKTIDEINTDFNASNMLQSTRVKIENAIIGTINPNGTTVISQGSDALNIYRIPNVEGLNEGDMITVTGIISCYDAPQLRVANAEDIEFSPQPHLTVAPSTLTGFTYVYENGGPSEIQNFEIDGENLTSIINVISSESFEISTNSGESFQSGSITVIDIPSVIYVRLKANLEVGNYNEQIVVACEDTDTLFVSVSGIVTGEGPTPPPTPTGNYVRINDLNQLTEGSFVIFAARFDDNTTDYYAMSGQSSGKPAGVLFTSATADDNEVLPASIVDDEINYYWIVGITANGYTFTNALGELIGYTSSTNFATGGDNTEWSIEAGTAGDEAMVPNYSGFLVTNVNNNVRHFALNSNHNFGPYHSNNLNNSGYNFYLDLFVKTEGGVPPTPTVATPTFSPAAGTYYEVQNVSITCATEDATIYYSTDTENGPWTAYTEAITVDQNMTIWAYAVKEGYNDSPVFSATYIIRLGVVTIFSQDWEGEMNGWTFVTVEGSKPWNVSQYQGNHYAYANGYNGGANEQWCISPGFNIHDYENVILSFRNAKNYNGPDLELKYSTNYDGVDPTTANWWSFDFNMSPGSYTWVESGDIPISIYPYPAHDCYIAFKYTSTETEAAAWEVDDIILTGSTSLPNLTVTPNSLSGFTHVVGEGPSETQYFTLSGVNIGPAPGGGSTGSIIIQSSENEFEVSIDNELFSWQVYIDNINGTLPPTPVYVRMNGAEVGTYSGVINIHASSSDHATVSLSGTVTEQPVPGDDYVRISDMSQLVAGNRIVFAARFDESSTDYYAMNSTASGHPIGVLFSSALNGSDEEILPTSILNDEEDFYWTVDITPNGYTFTNAAGEMIGYTSSTNFSPNGDNTAWSIEIGTSGETAMVPNYTGFVIANVNNPVRAFALNGSHNFGPYHTQNIAGENYNFFLDIFMQGEGGEPPIPTVAAPTFTPAGGTYYEAQIVTINCTTADATIYYSLVSEPYDWIEYEGPLAVDSNMTICAYAEKEGYNDSPVVCEEYIIQDDIVIIFWQDWEDDWDPWQGWTERCTQGDSLWRVASYGGNHYAYANGYNHPATVDWLISPAFDLDSYSDVVLTFNTARNYNGPDIDVYFSNDYDGQDPDLANWQPLECELSQGGWNWVESGDISLDGFSGTNCHIGFKYTSDEDAAGWEVDDIKLASGSTTPTPTLIATPNYLGDFSYVVGHGPSESQSYILSGVNLLDEGYIHIISCSWYEISLDDETFTEMLEFPCTELPKTIYVRMMEGLDPNTYDGVYIANEYTDDNNSYATVVVNLSGVVHSENEPMMSAWMPLYIQGNNGSNNNRVPVAVHVLFTNLYPNTTYHYTNQFVDENDGPETAGAGNVIYVSEEGFYRSTNPGLATSGGYGEFTTDGEGLAGVWLMNEPTANTRFTPGNHVYMRVRLNGGGDGTTPFYYFTSEDYATVLNFGTENNENSGSAFYVKSNEAPMTFAMLFATDMDVRPVYSTSIETTGVDYSSINQYADFYKEFVAGNDGWFGGILPNVNDDGIKYITTWDMAGFLQNQYLSEDGHWSSDANTVNPTNGLDEPIFIDLTYDGVEETVETNVKVWSADHEFVIENGDNAHYSMTVYNMIGQPIMMKQINAGSTEHISHSFATGVYIISLQNNQSKVSVKVVVR